MLARTLSLMLAAAVAGGMFAEVMLRPAPGDANPFHAAAAKAVDSVPVNLGSWEGVDLPVPTSARALLRPNAILSRSYRNRETGDRATLIIVQCRDTRDMAGHYPPICYPSQGWNKKGEYVPVALTVSGRRLDAVRYEFDRPDFGAIRNVVVYGFFAVPGAGFPVDMQQIRSLASDYVSRPYGAAQVHVVLDGSVEEQREVATVESLLGEVSPVLDLLADPKWKQP